MIPVIGSILIKKSTVWCAPSKNCMTHQAVTWVQLLYIVDIVWSLRLVKWNVGLGFELRVNCLPKKMWCWLNLPHFRGPINLGTFNFSLGNWRKFILANHHLQGNRIPLVTPFVPKLFVQFPKRSQHANAEFQNSLSSFVRTWLRKHNQFHVSSPKNPDKNHRRCGYVQNERPSNFPSSWNWVI